MARSSKEYWADRAAKLENRAHDKGEALAKKLKKQYRRASREITQKIEAFFGRYATEQGLSYAEARKKLNSKEAREWRQTLGEYVEEINALPDGPAKNKLIAELDARSYASQQDRLSQLCAQIDMEIDRLVYEYEGQMSLTMIDVLEDGYYRKAFDLQQRAGVLAPFARLSTEMIEDALTYPWSGADFSTRIWQNKRALLFNARQTITQGIIQGKSVAAMSNDLADTLGKSYTVAERLIRTEANHFHAEADMRAYTAAGVEQYEFMATLDHRTSEICASLDGNTFPVSEAKPGTNYPPMHPNCRSTTVEYDPEDAADWAASGEPMPERMTYEEWKREQDEKYGEGYVDTQRKKEYNYTKDQEQYERYKEMLGKNAPASVDAFQDLKYSDDEKWQYIKLDYSRRNNLLKHPEHALPNAEHVEAVADKFEKYLFNPQNPKGWAKGQLFSERLGYDADNWQELREEITQAAKRYTATFKKNNGFGDLYEQKMILYGKTNNPTNVIVGWIRTPDQSVRMTSAYIKEV